MTTLMEPDWTDKDENKPLGTFSPDCSYPDCRCDRICVDFMSKAIKPEMRQQVIYWAESA